MGYEVRGKGERVCIGSFLVMAGTQSQEFTSLPIIVSTGTLLLNENTIY